MLAMNHARVEAASAPWAAELELVALISALGSVTNSFYLYFIRFRIQL